jgi:hypothetical protein
MRKHQREDTGLPVPENCFGAGAAKAALTGGLRPLTVFNVLESGYPVSWTTCALLTQEENLPLFLFPVPGQNL